MDFCLCYISLYLLITCLNYLIVSVDYLICLDDKIECDWGYTIAQVIGNRMKFVVELCSPRRMCLTNPSRALLVGSGQATRSAYALHVDQLNGRSY